MYLSFLSYLLIDKTNRLPCLRVIFNAGCVTCLSLSPQPSGPVFPPLYPPSVDSALVSNDMEHELRSLVTDHRRVKQSIEWDKENNPSWSFQSLTKLLTYRVLNFFYPKDLGLNTTWDDELSYILTPALAAYELEHSTGVSAGNEEFQQAIRRAIPDGHTFKGFPIQFVHRNARRAFATCLRWAIIRIL